MKVQHLWRVLMVLSCFFAWLPPQASAGENINWHTFGEGMELGKSEKKMIFIHFYADWCFYCRKMAKETFRNPSVISSLNNDFVAIWVNSDKNRKVASVFGVRALPTTWFLTAKGEKIGNLPGYVSADQLLQVFKKIENSGR